MENITIYLQPIEAELFKQFQMNHEMFKLLVEKGVFKSKNAKISLNFNHLGELMTIQREDFLYSKKFS